MWAWKYGPTKVKEVEHRLIESDTVLRDVANIILELRANTENLEDILKRLKEDDDG